jgi:hypothetical protein
MDIHRAYKVLGLYPGASREDVRAAYRDMAQVWHPDRFPHNERLREKAERNLKRINGAFEILKDYDPPPDGVGRQSLLSATFSAVQDLGDMLQSGVMERPRVRPRERRGDIVLGLGEVERTGVMRVRRKRGSRGRWLAVVVVVLLVAFFIVVFALGR